MYVCDDVLEDPANYRAACLQAEYSTLTIGPAHFHGLAKPPDRRIAAWIQQRWPDLTVDTSMLRKSPLGQVEPTFIHQDRDMGTWSALYYLTPEPPAGDGTTFYREKATGRVQSIAQTPDAFLEEWRNWQEPDLWEPWTQVAAKFNRIVVFESSHFHARSIFQNYGTGDDARLIQLVFGTGVLTAPAIPLQEWTVFA